MIYSPRAEDHSNGAEQQQLACLYSIQHSLRNLEKWAGNYSSFDRRIAWTILGGSLRAVDGVSPRGYRNLESMLYVVDIQVNDL